MFALVFALAGAITYGIYRYFKNLLDFRVHQDPRGAFGPSQSEVYTYMKEHDASFRESKSDKHASESEEVVGVKVAIVDGRAYWVSSNGLTTAPVRDDDEIDYDSQKPVDAYSMSNEELKFMLEILDAIEDAE